MKRIVYKCFLILCLLVTNYFKGICQTAKQIIPINVGWSFSDVASPNQAVNLPHTWNIKDVMDDEPGYYRGVGIYYKTISSSRNWKDKEVFICFQGANQTTKLYINDKYVGQHIGGYTSFRFLISPYLVLGEQNEIRVEVDNSYNANIPPLTADFTFFGGIYRHVNLLIENKIHFYDGSYGSNGLKISSPQVSSASANLVVEGQIINRSQSKTNLLVTTNLLNALGQQVGYSQQNLTVEEAAVKGFKQIIPKITLPNLWSTRNPYLYQVITRVLDGKTGAVLDASYVKYGFRWFSFSARDGFSLNGEKLKLIGASRHQDFEGLGNAVPDQLQVKDVVLLKEMGANFLRVAHYPQTPAVLHACDSLGILTSVEIPVVNQISETDEFFGNTLHMQKEMIMQNYNHPSVVIWAYMNEVLLRLPFADDKTKQDKYLLSVADLAKRLDDLTRNEDSTRYTMIANHGNYDLYNRAKLLDIPQIIGWNLYQGWYGGKIEDFATYVDQLNQKQPLKPIIITEFGADADPRIRNIEPEKFDKSVEYALAYHQFYIDVIERKPFISGGAVWNLADFNSESREETMPHINNKGLLTWGRDYKDLYFFYKAHLSDKPYLKLTNWLNRAGEANSAGTCLHPLMVFTNQDSVKLYANGIFIGTKASIKNVATFNVAFKAGVNQITAMSINGKTLDSAYVDFTLTPSDLSHQQFPKEGLKISLGDKRFYIEPDIKAVWLPAKPYQKDKWGFIGGKPYSLPNKNRQPYGTDKNIIMTEDDPIYQTQQVGIEKFRLDVADGEYQITLHFAELIDDKQRDALPYNLDVNTYIQESSTRVFDVLINEKTVLKQMDIAQSYGTLKAMSRNFNVKARDGKGIEICFLPIVGKPILNAIEIKQN